MFVEADQLGSWTHRHYVNGMTILQCPKGMFICDADAKCTAVYYEDCGVEEQMASIVAAMG